MHRASTRIFHSEMSKQDGTSASVIDTPIPGLNISTAIALFLLVTTVLPLYVVETTPNTLALIILFFNNLNILICLCEIALGNHIKFIQRDYLERKKLYEGKEYKAAFYYLTMPLSLSTLFSGEKWAIMWSTYALWDPSYQNQESFGFFIDVGNGWSTIPTGLLWDIAILCPAQLESSWQYSWLLVGVLGCASYWQVCYGTLVYFLSFFFNKRHVGRPIAEVLGFVAFANGIWIFFPVFCLYAAVLVLRDQAILSVFR